MTILVTGGAGYIGSHCVRYLYESGHTAIALDNLSKGYAQSVNTAKAKLYIGDISDEALLDKIFCENRVDAVIHFAAFSLVGESMQKPYEYYKNNVAATLSLLNSMLRNNVKRIVFSSTAATYGLPKKVPIVETAPQEPINTYGETKLAIEKMMKWFDTAYGLQYVALRYFNVAGAHESGEIGEAHSPETHLIPLILQVASGKRGKIDIYGDDYATRDGTCVRDYIHVHDLIDAHIKALEYLMNGGASDAFNLGSGGGFSNLEVLAAARKITGHSIPSEIGPRRAGDPNVLFASSKKAEKALKWTRKYTTIESIIESAWKWHSVHKTGY